MSTYYESDRAVRAWDWFNEGKVIYPLSFCQFWRTLLLYVPVKFLLLPFQRLGRLVQSVPIPGVPGLGLARRLIALLARSCWFAAGIAVRGFWLSTYPLRLVARPVGCVALAGVVGAGGRVEAFSQEHKTGLEHLGLALIIVVAGGELIFVGVMLLLLSWFWTLIGIGSLVGGSFAVYGFAKSGAPRLLWEAAVAAKHGVCPPVTIVREGPQ